MIALRLRKVQEAACSAGPADWPPPPSKPSAPPSTCKTGSEGRDRSRCPTYYNTLPERVRDQDPGRGCRSDLSPPLGRGGDSQLKVLKVFFCLAVTAVRLISANFQKINGLALVIKAGFRAVWAGRVMEMLVLGPPSQP